MDTTTIEGPAWLSSALGESELGSLRVARDYFQQFGFPTSKLEEWKYFDLRKLKNFSYKPGEGAAALDLSKAQELLSKHSKIDESSSRLVFIDGEYSEDLSDKSDLFRLETHSEINTSGILAERELTDYDFLLAMHAAFARTGLTLKVKPGSMSKVPVEIVMLTSDGSARNVFAPSLHIDCPANTEVNFVERTFGPNGYEYLTLPVTSFTLGAGANVHHVRINRDGDDALHLGRLVASVEKDSHFHSTIFSTGAASSRLEAELVFLSDHADANINGLTMLRGEQTVDTNTVVRHRLPHCESGQLYKGIYADKSVGSFSGTIIVSQDAQKTNAIQNNQSLLLSDTASSKSKPQLKIWADDVKCTHGATIGQLDDQALFYLRSRGIDTETARRMLIHAFASDVLTEIKNEGLRSELENLLSSRLETIFGVH